MAKIIENEIIYIYYSCKIFFMININLLFLMDKFIFYLNCFVLMLNY